MTLINARLVAEAVLVILAFAALMVTAMWYVIRARRATPDAISELVASNTEMAQRMRALEREMATSHAALLSFQTRLELQTAYSRAQTDYIRRWTEYGQLLADRLRELSVTDIPPAPGNPPTPPAELTAPIMAVDQPPVVELLPVILAALFNIEELDDLALRIGARPEDLIGETVTRRAHSLALWARRHNKLDRLVAVARALRPEGDI